VLGILFVATAAYLAAVYLSADAVRLGRADLEAGFRRRALAMVVVAGAAAAAGLAVVRSDAKPLWDGLTSGGGLGAVLASAAAGVATVALVLRRRYGWARVSAATAVAAIVAGWGLAQRPDLLPGLTIEQAAAGHSTLVAVVVALAVGAVVLLPSLAFLFSLFLRGRFDEGAAVAAASRSSTGALATDPLFRAAALCFVLGVALTVIVESPWGRIIGVPLLLAFVALGAVGLATAITAREAGD
jgi:cytochrome d ubiquinol oxidase subunit II